MAAHPGTKIVVEPHSAEVAEPIDEMRAFDPAAERAAVSKTMPSSNIGLAEDVFDSAGFVV